MGGPEGYATSEGSLPIFNLFEEAAAIAKTESSLFSPTYDGTSESNKRRVVCAHSCEVSPAVSRPPRWDATNLRSQDFGTRL
jgi:hypothetical protein